MPLEDESTYFFVKTTINKTLTQTNNFSNA